MTEDQLTAALALIELDGVARRIVVCPPDLAVNDIPLIMAAGRVDVVVSDRPSSDLEVPGLSVVTCSPGILEVDCPRRAHFETEWVLLTSGTSGRPKLVLHTLSTLAGVIARVGTSKDHILWGTFYDIRRYGGLQILLRTLIGGGSLVLPSPHEPLETFLTRMGERGVSHISGTPSHWRRALMSPAARKIFPHYIRLSGEIVDEAILVNLRTFYKDARIVHAFASTEAGVAFEVADGHAGFPASLVGRQGNVELKICGGSLRIRSPRVAIGYLDGQIMPVADRDGFVDTADMVELKGDRYYFIGRRDGVINVGGLKVHPEEVEAVINRHPAVRMSLVRARKSPVTGAIVTADVVIADRPGHACQTHGAETLKSEILEACRRALAPHKVPAVIRLVERVTLAPSGKLARN